MLKNGGAWRGVTDKLTQVLFLECYWFIVVVFHKIISISLGIVFNIMIIASIVFYDQYHHAQEKLESLGK